MQMFLNDNDMDDVRSVYDIAQHLFEKVGYHGKHLMFQSKNHISRGEAAVTTILDIMKNFARDQGGFFTEEDLEAYLKSVGVKTGNLRGQMQVYDKPIFLFYAEHTYITMAMILDIEEEISELRNSMCKRQREILTILDKMEPEYATVLSGRFIEGKSVKELGVVLFLSRRQIERRMIDALAEFQIKLNDLIENGDLSSLSRNDS